MGGHDEYEVDAESQYCISEHRDKCRPCINFQGTFVIPRHYVGKETLIGNHVSQTGVGKLFKHCQLSLFSANCIMVNI